MSEPELSDRELRAVRWLIREVPAWETGQEPKRLSGFRIAVVDDSPDALDVVGCILEQHGARVDRYPSAEIALAEVLIHRPDVVVSDVAMEDRDGLWLMRELRKTDLPTRAIALSAHARGQDKANALAAGFELHLSKPVDPDALISAVAGLVKGGSVAR